MAGGCEAMIWQQHQLLNALAEQLVAGTGIVASKEANARLEETAEFHRVLRGAIDDAMRRWKRGPIMTHATMISSVTLSGGGSAH